MKLIYYILLGLGVLCAVCFVLLVLLTGKGDAMSGGTSIRTSFKGQATFEDLMSRVVLTLGIMFMAITFVINILSVHINWGN